MEIALPGSAVLGLTVAARLPLLFSLDNQFPGAAGSKLFLHSYSIPFSSGPPPGPNALCYRNGAASALSLQIIQDPELM